MSTFLLSQILAALALGFGLVSYQSKATRWILLGMLICNLLSASHFFLLYRPGPAALQLATAARFSVAVFTTGRRVMVLFLLVTAGIFIASIANALSVVACVGTRSPPTPAFNQTTAGCAFSSRSQTQSGSRTTSWRQLQWKPSRRPST